MNKAALVIMAAGVGSRYGGNKQVDGIGPDNEILMEYSIWDALRAGFTKVVFIVKPGMEELVERLCGARTAARKAPDGSAVEVCYAVQDFAAVPAFYTVPPERSKPLGTAHAVLCAKDCLSEPFAVINADDYYGVDAYQTIYNELVRLPAEGAGTMVGYSLRNTVSPNGTVTRGLCEVENDRLVRIVETFKIKLFPDGVIRDVASGEDGPVLAPDTKVSMNFWGFTPSVFGKLEAYLEEFLKGLAPDDIKSECLLPTAVGEWIDRGEMAVSVLHSPARWFGMTYQEDKPEVRRELQALHDAGVYPPTLHE